MITEELNGLSGALVLPSGPPACVSVSSVTDTDGDGVPDDSDFTFSASGCAFAFTDGSGVRTLNDTRSLRGSASGTTLQQDIQLGYTSTGDAAVAATETWGATFTPEQGSSCVLAIGARLPPGSATVSGTLDWSQGGSTLELELETVSPIEWPAGCESPFPSVGEVHVNVLSGGPGGYLRIRYVGCAEEVETEFVPD